ncbi:uncharacterized protein I303_106697 [Kwoniella dejecticola CBS 10117]|uniref:Flavin reductase like domain-containing protein n=1 Tax=Kwoniella dejecticola CBS 10117 TaxID=1296121 RepID=A0A1A5ZU11_9TREE|nr:uncharacterized protein I303_08661 [Kwoniella dejecticola CBS 10117]OBR81275.1 hypothetical protein I303_08661 [Kwoniella dejecticola CBS 10117]
MLVVTRATSRSYAKSPVQFIKRYFSQHPHPNGTRSGQTQDPSVMLREVMRNVAQPVAIAVTSVPLESNLHGKSKYHGATLTSFTSLTLYPHPLVAFSLRLPSRMADCLRPFRTHEDHRRRQHRQQQQQQQQQSESSRGIAKGKGIILPPKSELPWPLSRLPMPEQPPEWAQSLFASIPNPLHVETVNPLTTSSSSSSSTPTSSTSISNSTSNTQNQNQTTQNQNQNQNRDVIPLLTQTPLTISLLSTENEHIADALSLPATDHSSIFNRPETWVESPSQIESETRPQHPTHPPSLKDAIGSLHCQVVGSVLLKDLCGPESLPDSGAEAMTGEGSELFICRVMDVQMNPDESLEPLLHWRRKYVGIKEEQNI